MVGTRPRLTETAQGLGRESLPGDEGRTGCLRDHPRLPITTATESRETGPGHPATGAPSAAWEELAARAAGVTSTPTSRATKESVWTDTSETVVETAGHEADRRLPDESGTTATADRITIGLAHLVTGTTGAGRVLTSDISTNIRTKAAVPTPRYVKKRTEAVVKPGLGNRRKAVSPRDVLNY